MNVEQASMRTDLDDHLARVDGLLLALEQELRGPAEGETPFTRKQVPPPPESSRPPATDRLSVLIRRYGLDRYEADLLRLAVSAELSTTHAELFAQLQGDRRLRRPQVALALRLLEPDPVRQTTALTLLQEGRSLRRHHLLELTSPWRDRMPLFTEQELSLPPALLFDLAGAREVDARLAGALTLVEPRARLADLVLSEESRRTLEALAGVGRGVPSDARLGPPDVSSLLLYMHGPYGTGRKSAAQALARAWGLGLLLVDLRRVQEDSSPASFLNLVLRDARRLMAAPLFLHIDRMFEQPRSEDAPPSDPLRLERFIEALEDFPGPVMLAGTLAPDPHPAWHQRQFIEVPFVTPTRGEEQLALWSRALRTGNLAIEAVGPVVQQFALSPGQMRDAVAAASSRAASRDFLQPLPEVDDLRAGCAAQFKHKLESLSRKTRSLYHWNDLILPDPIKAQLRMFEGFIRNREQVYETWGLGRKLSSGRGIKALFHGASGTGKTMAAQVIASTLGIDLFKVDLSTLVSKWVGETEKNLDRVFTEAQKSHSIILFDEADSLFGKRGAVEKGTDRYSNMEINFLLQRFEEYDGVVILTSNFPRGIDDAFSRRMHFIVEFPTPSEDMRRRLWESMIPPELPLDADVSLDRLVKGFELTGGNISNIVLGASFLAAERGGVVRMLDIMRAIQWEYQKIGRSASRSEFGEFFDQLEPDGA